MVDKISKEDFNEVNELGTMLNPKFRYLFHIENLNDNEIIYVYKENQKVLGFIHILVNYEVIEILNIIVKEEYQNRHIATLLMDYMITEIKQNIEKIILEVECNNIKAINLYNKFNFIEIHRRKNYYGINDAIIMERSLI